MKKLLSVTIMSCMIVMGVASLASAATLSAVYDFSDQLDATQTSFEGLDFDADGNLWITSAPNQADADNALLKVNLDTKEVNIFDFSSSPNPVGLAINGNDFFASNAPGGVYSVSIDGDTVDTGVNVSGGFFFNFVCSQPEGAAYYNDKLYVSCENGKIFEINPQTGVSSQIFNTGTGALGLGATDDGRLIIGQYNPADALDRSLLLYDIATGLVTEEIDLNDLFPGYEHTIVDNGDIRHIPDPDGLAYRDGKIYMTFEHDLQVYEIALGTPEPGTLLLIGSGLLALAGLRKKRS